MTVAIVGVLVAATMLTFARVTSFRSTRTSGRISVAQKRSTKPCARLSKGVGARADRLQRDANAGRYTCASKRAQQSGRSRSPRSGNSSRMPAQLKERRGVGDVRRLRVSTFRARFRATQVFALLGPCNESGLSLHERSVHAVGGELGTFDITLNDCQSGERESFNGADRRHSRIVTERGRRLVRQPQGCICMLEAWLSMVSEA